MIRYRKFCAVLLHQSGSIYTSERGLMGILCTLITKNKAKQIDTYLNKTFRLSFNNHCHSM